MIREMKKTFVLLASILLAFNAFATPVASAAGAVDGLDLNRTLRVDYIFSGTDKTQEIALAELCSIDGWAGRRVNMDKVPLRGNGQVIMSVRSGSGEFDTVVYEMSFSTLFQAVGKGLYSMIMSFSRQLIVLLPVAWLLSGIDLQAMWYAFPAAEVASLGLAAVFFILLRKKQLSRMD